MHEENFFSQVKVCSQILEEVSSLYSAVSELEKLFLQEKNNKDVNFQSYHSDLKRVYTQALKYSVDEKAGHLTPTKEKFNSQKINSFVPVMLETYNCFEENEVEVLPKLDHGDYDFRMTSYNVTTIVPQIKEINYPISSSVPFSFVDNRQELLQLTQKILNQNEFGLFVIYHPKPLTLCAICISLRECEYLIDPAEIPSCVEDLNQVLADKNITKVVHNAAETFYFLHLFGAKEINNVFCISTASYALRINPSLKELTSDFRKRLGEGWISSENEIILKPRIAEDRSENELIKMIKKYKSNAKHDWRFRPFSLVQMQRAKQQIHYLLYLYDSLRLKLVSKTNMLKYVLLISNQKANMDWRIHIFNIFSPNPVILSSLFHQPLPDQILFTQIMAIKNKYPMLTDALILWICLEIPKTIEELISIEKLVQQKHQMFLKPFVQLPKAIEQLILAITTDMKNTGTLQKQAKPRKKQETIDEIVAELGWFSEPESIPINTQTDFQIETTLSPKQIQSSNTPSSLLNLRDPEQPTSVSLQIPGIPQTEKYIYEFANNLRLIQKIQGKSKTKLVINKEENIQEEAPEKAIARLVRIGYINEKEAQKICMEKKIVPKYSHIIAKKRSCSADKTQQKKQNYQRAKGIQH